MRFKLLSGSDRRFHCTILLHINNKINKLYKCNNGGGFWDFNYTYIINSQNYMNVIFLLGWCNYKSKVDTYPSICGAAYSSKLRVKSNVAIGWGATFGGALRSA